MAFDVYKSDEKLDIEPSLTEREKYVASEFTVHAEQGIPLTLYKYVANVTSRNYGLGELVPAGKNSLLAAKAAGFESVAC